MLYSFYNRIFASIRQVTKCIKEKNKSIDKQLIVCVRLLANNIYYDIVILCLKIKFIIYLFIYINILLVNEIF